MLPIAVTVALSALISFQPVAARSGLPYIVPRHLIKVKRQGTFVPSTDATDFGSCTTPQIEGGLGFDNRVEFSFQPVDQTSYPHTSAQNIGIITQFICDTLVNTCGASTAAHDLCTATEAKIGAGKNDGALADTFNAAFGLTTSFANVAGSVSATSGSSAAASSVAASSNVVASSSAVASTTASAAASTVTVTVDCTGSTAVESASAAQATSTAVAAASPPTSAASTSLDLGTCSDPSIVFKDGLDGRDQAAFIASNQADFNHGSALAIGVIASFISQQLASSCKAGADAISAATSGAAAATAAGATTGAAADAWNAAFGITTSFATTTGAARH